jgi:predicted anti-sigma-YlaC factor YlaD
MMNDIEHPQALQIPAYLAGALNMREKLSFKKHLRTCIECKQTLNELKSICDHIPAAASNQVTPPDNLRGSILDKAEDTPQRQTLPSQAAGQVKDGIGTAAQSENARRGFFTVLILAVFYFIARKRR